MTSHEELISAIEGFRQAERDAIAVIEAEMTACLELEGDTHKDRVSNVLHACRHGIPRHRAAIAAYSNVLGLLTPQQD